MDQTSHCEKWVQKFPENCEPNYDANGFSENRYPFMREVCQESCHKRSGNFRGNKCEKVIEIFEHELALLVALQGESIWKGGCCCSWGDIKLRR